MNDVGVKAPRNVTRNASELHQHFHSARVATIDLAQFVHFVHRHLHKARGDLRPTRGRLMMKLDTEGAEAWLLPHLIAHHALCVADLLFIEWHPDPRQNGTVSVIEAHRSTLEAVKQPGCKTVLSTIDDETFLLDGKPFPTERICAAPDAARGAIDHGATGYEDHWLTTRW